MNSKTSKFPFKIISQNQQSLPAKFPSFLYLSRFLKMLLMNTLSELSKEDFITPKTGATRFKTFPLFDITESWALERKQLLCTLLWLLSSLEADHMDFKSIFTIRLTQAHRDMNQQLFSMRRSKLLKIWTMPLPNNFSCF